MPEATKQIRVLVVDDSIFMRKSITLMLNESADLTVVGNARSGEEALRKIAELKPDVMTLDIEMPGMDGLAVIETVMATNPMPVVVVSSHTEAGAAVTLRALELGAIDFLPKNLGGSYLRITAIRDQLIEKVRVAAQAFGKLRVRLRLDTHEQATPCGVGVDRSKSWQTSELSHLVVIGCSTGGPQALQEILPQLPADLPAPVVIGQHMPKYFTKHLAERLNQLSRLEVHEADDQEIVRSGVVFVAPGGYHLTFQQNGRQEVQIRVSEEPHALPYRPSIDLMMQSAVQVLGSRVMGVILTGMGHDGLEGMRAIHAAGGFTLAQDEATSVIYGMPKAVADAGCADRIMPLTQIAGEIACTIERHTQTMFN